MRRLKQRTSFGRISVRERRNADLFFIELLGLRRPRRSSSPVPETYAPETYAPEAYAPEAYAPETYTEAPETDPAPTVTPGANADEIIVTRADGTKFHVRRKVRARVLTRPGRPRAGICTDDRRVFFRVSWCEGTQGTIDLGANPQGAVKDLMDKVFTQISRGASPDEIRQTFENASVQAFLDIDITKVGSWKITGDVRLDLNRTGIASTSVGVSADTGWLKLGVEYSREGDDNRVIGKIEIPLEKRKVKGKECPVRELIVWWDIECLREVPFTYTIKPPVDTIERQEQLFLYFYYAKDTLRIDPKPSATPKDEVAAVLASEPTAGTARLNKRALQRFDYLVEQGYWLFSVAGYASPEGRRPAPGAKDRGAMAKWEGNDALSTERAEKILKIVTDRYRPNLGMRASPGGPPLMRFPPDRQMPKGVGRSENPRLDDRFGRELEGAALDRAMINGDTALGLKPFLDANPDEAARMTTEDKQYITDTRNTLRNRAERLFENLRRVEIHLRKYEKLKDTPITSFVLKHEHNCPTDLVEAAEKKWGSRIPFNKPDPPICN
jgi:hypothetical protein